MKYIKLFEDFNTYEYELPNFRVSLVTGGMTNGKYLFSLVDGHSNSYWGVFDLEGLKVLEDEMNTICVLEELFNAIAYNKKNDPVVWATKKWTKLVINKVPEDSKLIVLLNKLVVDKDIMADWGIRKNLNILGAFHEYIADVVSDENEIPEVDFGLSRDEGIIIVPAEVNTLYHEGNHLGSFDDTTGKIIKDKRDENYFGIDYENPLMIKHDNNYTDPKFRNAPPDNKEWISTPINFDDIEPYMPSIIEAGAPKAFLKVIEKYKGIRDRKPTITKIPTFIEGVTQGLLRDYGNDLEFKKFLEETDYIQLVDQLEKVESEFRRGRDPEKLSLIKPLVDKREGLINVWERRLPSDFIKMERSDLGITRYNYGLR
jgi:hypothetical protein